MTTTHDDDATTWRDLADALTPEQVAELEYWESRPDLPPMPDWSAPPPERHQAALLFTARQFAGQNAAAAYYADVAPPAEDGQHHPWEDGGDGEWQRFFVGTTRNVGDVEVTIAGFQSADGTITRSISISKSEELTAAEARQIAAALIEAADEIERLK